MSGPLNPGFTAEGFMITLAVQAIGAVIAIGGALLVSRYSLQQSFAYERDLRRQEEEHRHAERTRVDLENRCNLLAAVRAELNVNVEAVAWMEESPRATFLLRREMLNQCFVVLPVLPRTLAKALVEASIDVDRYERRNMRQRERPAELVDSRSAAVTAVSARLAPYVAKAPADWRALCLHARSGLAPRHAFRVSSTRSGVNGRWVRRLPVRR